MKPIARSNWLTFAGLLLALPALWIIFISLLKYGLNIDGPFEFSKPLLESWGIADPFGFNINLVILFGPVIGFILAMIQVVSINWQFTKEQMKFNISIYKKWFPISVMILCAGVLASLFIYMLGENCNCNN